MGRKKSKWNECYIVKGFVHCPHATRDPKNKSEAYVALFKTLRNDPAYKALTGNQRVLYQECLAQWTEDPYKEGKFSDLSEVSTEARLESFYMNWALGREIGIYRSKDTFYKDLKRLEEIGFIKCLYHGHARGDKSLYRLASDWKDFQPS